MSPSQGLPEEHSPLEEDDEIVLGARVEDVVGAEALYSDPHFCTSATAGDISVRLSKRAACSYTAVTADVVGVSVEDDSGQPYAEDEEFGDVGRATEETKTVLAS